MPKPRKVKSIISRRSLNVPGPIYDRFIAAQLKHQARAKRHVSAGRFIEHLLDKEKKEGF